MSDGIVALAGNPNTGKSTLFNRLTGLKQHTGNWPGKTVEVARGTLRFRDRVYTAVDLPGTYSLRAESPEEEVARDFLWLAEPDVTVVVCDATNLERNLSLVLQVIEITRNTVVCVNLIDEARRTGLQLDKEKLAAELGVPVAATSAVTGEGVEELLQAVDGVASGALVPEPMRLEYSEAVERAAAPVQAALQRWGLSPHQARWAALRLIEGEQMALPVIEQRIRVRGGERRELSSVQSAG
jgi:Fe2+ transport system protein B